MMHHMAVANPDSEQERREREKKEFAEKLELIMNITTRILNRYQQTPDPVTRFSLFIDKFCIILDVASGYLDSQLDELQGVPPELRVKCKMTSDLVQQEMKALLEWIQSPHYGPDHPVGANLMQQAKTHFTKLESSNGKSE